MSQNRDAPAFQEYAAGMMARVEYRTMSLAGRGLLYSMRLECWVNRRVPNKPETLARMLGFDQKEIETALHEVMPFFSIDNGQIVCPELDDYRAHLDAVRAKKSAGGKLGAARTNGKRKAMPNKAGKTVAGIPSGISRDSRDSLVQHSQVQTSQKQSLEESVNDEPCEAYKSWMHGD